MPGPREQAFDRAIRIERGRVTAMGFFSDMMRRAQGLPTESDVRMALQGLQNQIMMLTNMADAMDSAAAGTEFEDTFGFALRFDLMNFALHIAAADGVLEPSEVQAINMMLGSDFTYGQCKKAIEEQGLGSDELSYGMPRSFMLLTAFAHGTTPSAKAKEFSESLISTYEALGLVIANVDGDFDESEQRDLERYISMLRMWASKF